MNDIKQKTVKAAFWAFTSTIGGRLISSIVYILLARLLSPSDYGLIAYLSIILVIGTALQDVGLGDALINKTITDNIDMSTMFFFNLFMGVLLFTVNWVLAPYVAAFYHESQLVPLLRFTSCTFIISSCGLVQKASLRKELEYAVLTKTNLISMLISGLIGVVCAYKGAGVWSLAIQNVSQTFVYSISISIYRKWVPSMRIRISSLTSMLRYGFALISANQLDSLVNNSYPMLIGKYYNKTITGYYANAYSLFSLVCSTTTGVLYQVAFPTLSKLKNDRVALILGYDKFIKITAFIVFPMMLFLFASANSLYLALLGRKWLQAVPYFKLLCLVGISHPIFIMNRCLLAASGSGKLTLKTSLIKNTLAVVLLILTIRYSINLMLVGMVVSTVFAALMNMYYTRHYMNVSVISQTLQILPTLMVAIVSSYLICLVDNAVNTHYPSVLFLIEMFLYIVVYLLLCKLLKLKSLAVFNEVILETSMVPQLLKALWKRYLDVN